MEDFREIVGFLIIGIGILISVLKERKDKSKSGSGSDTQDIPIHRRPIPTQAQQRQAQAQRQASTQRQAAAQTRRPEHSTTSIPLVVSSLAQNARQSQQSATVQQGDPYQENSHSILPEEGVRVTRDIPQTDTAADLAQNEEEQLIEKLREGIILSEILKRKF